MESLPVPPRRLAAEREAAVSRIQSAYADEVISYDEMSKRLDGVLAAPTGDEVLGVIADLPAVFEDGALEIEAISGRIKRVGTWRVPGRIRIRIASEYGQVKLDLSHLDRGRKASRAPCHHCRHPGLAAQVDDTHASFRRESTARRSAHRLAMRLQSGFLWR